jgi:multidrug efflux pump subunit AcrA (membrane-fusion protein)
LDRTRIHAPFDAQVLERNVNVGSQVSTGDNLARLVGMDTYWVETTVPLSSLRWMSFPDTPGAPGSRVRIRDRSAWSEGEYRTGKLDKLVGEVEDQARMARVLVTVDDPLLHDDVNSDSPSLLLGSFVQTRIQGEKIRNVVRLDRKYLRDDDTVWVMEDGELDVRDVAVVYRDSEYAYVREGLRKGDRIVTTNLSTVVDGAPLRLKETPSEQENSSPESSQ